MGPWEQRRDQRYIILNSSDAHVWFKVHPKFELKLNFTNLFKLNYNFNFFYPNYFT